jgi:hypothetical protein
MSSYFDNKELFTGPKMNQYGSHMVMTNVTKTSKIKYVNIDTKFRDEYNSSITTDYTITLPERITDVRTISVTNLEVPNTFFNISENIGNNAMKITSGASTGILMLRDGNYNQSTLLTELNARKTALGSPFTNLTFDASFNKITITPASGTFALDFGVDSTGAFAKYNFKTRLGWLLGFRNQTYTGITSRLTSEYMYSLTGPRYLYLVVDEFTSNGNQKSFVAPLPSSVLAKHILARITLDGTTYPFMSVIPATNQSGLLLSDVRSYTGKVDIQKLNVQLVNENGTPMNLNGADFSFCLQIEHE